MNATEEYKFGRTLCCRSLCEFERITGDIGESDYFIALIMMTKDEGAITQSGSGSYRSSNQSGITCRR
jgi:hypothetical protein